MPATQTSISPATFETLPFDYARHHNLIEGECTTASEICGDTVGGTRGQVRLHTTDGVIVAKEVMDLVDRLVEHHTDSTATIPNTPPGPHGTVIEDSGELERELVSFDMLKKMVEDLRRAHAHIKAVVEESRKAAREACADVFILQRQVEKWHAYQSSVSAAVQNVSGDEAIQELQAQIGNMERRKASDTLLGVSPLEILNKRAVSHLPPSNTSHYHLLNLPPTTSADGLKRSYVEEDDPQELGPAHGHKRRRLSGRLSPATPQPGVQQTILTYCDDEETTDDTYSDSEGTERDFIDDPYSFLDRRGYPPKLELRYRDYKGPSDTDDDDDSSDEEMDSSSDSGNGIPWSKTLDFGDDSSDSDYKPPNWDMEDIWEIDSKSWSHLDQLDFQTYGLLHFNFADELLDCGGVLSDCGLSTDDPDDKYYGVGTVRHPSFRSAASLPGYLRTRAPFMQAWEQLERGDITETSFNYVKRSKLWQKRRLKWEGVKMQCSTRRFPPLDLEERQVYLLTSDHPQFQFDDVEWKYFAEPVMSTRTVCM